MEKKTKNKKSCGRKASTGCKDSKVEKLIKLAKAKKSPKSSKKKK